MQKRMTTIGWVRDGVAVVDGTPLVDGYSSFDEFYFDEFPRMVEIAYARSGSRMAAEDLAQEAMIAALRRWSEIRHLERPGAWVRRVLLNRAASAFHRRKAEARALIRLAPFRGEPVSSLSAESAEFWQAVRGLSPRQGDTLILHYLEDLPIREIAGILECSESTVKVHLHRGRAALASRLSIEEEGS